jgi:hypothetical protein
MRSMDGREKLPESQWKEYLNLIEDVRQIHSRILLEPMLEFPHFWSAVAVHTCLGPKAGMSDTNTKN